MLAVQLATAQEHPRSAIKSNLIGAFVIDACNNSTPQAFSSYSSMRQRVVCEQRECDAPSVSGLFFQNLGLANYRSSSSEMRTTCPWCASAGAAHCHAMRTALCPRLLPLRPLKRATHPLWHPAAAASLPRGVCSQHGC